MPRKQINIAPEEAFKVSKLLHIHNAFEVADQKAKMGGTSLTFNSGNGEVRILLSSAEATTLIRLCKEHYAQKLREVGVNIKQPKKPRAKS